MREARSTIHFAQVKRTERSLLRLPSFSGVCGTHVQVSRYAVVVGRGLLVSRKGNKIERESEKA